jgi:hypothetical protein
MKLYSPVDFDKIFHGDILGETAIKNNDLEMLKYLVQCGFDIKKRALSKSNICYLELVCSMDNINLPMMQFLFDKGYPIDGISDDDISFHILIMNNKNTPSVIIDGINMFIKNGFDINSRIKYYNPIKSIINNCGHPEVIAKLIMFGWKLPNIPNSYLLAHFGAQLAFIKNDIEMYLKKEKESLVDILSANMDNGKHMLPFPSSGGHLALFEMVVDYMFNQKVNKR